ncbi:MAG TPA: hypothetical protein ENK74_05450 [Nitratifractor sp.]|nr:hypothetical protein [Nitratifractor sp.]
MKWIQNVILTIFGVVIFTSLTHAAAIDIYCPKPKVRTAITTPLPAGWWQTPQVGSLQRAEVKNLAGKPTIFCKYLAYGTEVSVMKRVPRGYVCRSVGRHVKCSTAGFRPLFSLTGLWHGATNTRSLTKLKIYKVGRTVKVHAWGKCHPNDCDWGVANAQVINRRKIVVYWNQGYVKRRMVIRKYGQSRIKVTTYNRYIDGRGRRTNVEFLHR